MVDDKSKEQSRSWMVTLKAEDFSKEEVESRLSKYTYVGQLEKGAEGYLHWQIYIENASPIKFSTLKNKFPSGHFEQRRGTRRGCYEYVTKDESSQGVRVSHGEMDLDEDKPRGRAAATEALRSAILVDGKSANDVILTMPEAASMTAYARDLEAAREAKLWSTSMRTGIEVHYIWGRTGVGKTRYVLEKHGLGNVHHVSDYKHPFDDYVGEDVLLLDEFSGQLPLELMLRVLDIYPVKLPARYRDRWAGFNTVYVVSNIPLTRQYEDVKESEPEKWRALERRFTTVSELTEDGLFLS